jgi:hypothetical protein
MLHFVANCCQATSLCAKLDLYNVGSFKQVSLVRDLFR